MTIDELRDKKIAVLGIGAEGLAVAKYLFNEGIPCTVLDQKQKEQLDQPLQTFLIESSTPGIFGPDYLDHLSDFEVIFRSPGIWRLTPQLIAAEKAGTIITSQTIWFFENCPCPIVGVTGTKGKGTTSALITQILQSAIKSGTVRSGSFLDGADAVYLTGNIGLESPLELLPRLSGHSIVVFELSSFQLQDLKKSPQVAVVLMTTVEHLDVHASEQEYHEAKQNIARYQTHQDFAIINRDYPASQAIGGISSGNKIYFSTQAQQGVSGFVDQDQLVINVSEERCSIPTPRIQLRGKHNWQNILAASLAASVCGALSDQVVSAVVTFTGLPYRLELVGTYSGVLFYNDSFSTTPETTIAAIQSFTEPLILIVGGSEKQSDFTELGRVIALTANIKALIMIGVTAPRILDAINHAGGFKGRVYSGAVSILEIMDQIKSIAQRGDVVLLSPACASFGMFKNYKDRGDQFTLAAAHFTLE